MTMIPVDTAVQIIIGPLLDAATRVSAVTGEAYNAGGMAVRLLKSSDTGVPTSTTITPTTSSTNDWVELALGYYYLEITAAQNDTEGKLRVVGSTTAAAPFESAEFDVVPTAVYNAMVSGSSSIANIVWDALKSAHAVADSMGEIQQTPQAVAGSAVNSAAASYVLTTGTQSSGTFADTASVDSTHHEHTDDAGAMDLYYEYSIGGDGLPTGVDFVGRLNGGNDTLSVYAWDWGLASWDVIATLTGKGGSSDDEFIYGLLTSHVGTAGDLGKVRIRFEAAASLTSATLRIDRCTVSYVIASRSVGYANGAVWLDTSLSNTTTESFVDGVADNPVSTLAAATTIAEALGLKRIEISPGSTITLAQSYAGYTFTGSHANIALGGQNVSGAGFVGANISGNDSGTNAIDTHYDGCSMEGNTLGIHELHSCAIAGDMVNAEAGDIIWDSCHSAVAGTGTPSFDFGAAVATTAFSVRNYSGGLEIKNLEASPTDTMSFEGAGQLIINASCVGGTLAIRGNISLTDNSGDAVTLSEDARVTRSSIDTTLTASHGSGSWLSALATGARTITFTVQDDDTNPVANVSLSIFDSGNTIFLGRVVTNGSGIATANLDDATYSIRQERSLYTPDNAVESLIVTASASVTYDGTIYTAADATLVTQCRISGYLRNAGGAVGANERVFFRATVPQNDAATIVYANEQVTALTDSLGFFQADLDRGITVIVSSTFIGFTETAKTVPSAASQEFATW